MDISAQFCSADETLICVSLNGVKFTVSQPSLSNPDGQIQHTIASWINAGAAIAPYEPPPITADDVRAEAQRRIIALVGAKDFIGCLVKQLNANALAGQLNDIRFSRALTAEEDATATALRNMFSAIKAIRAASNVLEASPPKDFTDDKYWK